MSLNNYGWFVVIVVAVVLSLTIVVRVMLYKKHRRAVQAASSSGLPFPVMTNLSGNAWRPSGADRPPTDRLTRGQPDVVRVVSRTDGDLPSYHDPGVKVPEAIYNPASSPVVSSLHHTSSPAPPPAPTGAPPGYEAHSTGR